MVGADVVDMVYKWGVLPLLITAVGVLWNKISNLEKQVSELNESQKGDLRNHAEEVKTIQQNTINTLSDHKTNQELTLEHLKEIKTTLNEK